LISNWFGGQSMGPIVVTERVVFNSLMVRFRMGVEVKRRRIIDDDDRDGFARRRTEWLRHHWPLNM